MSLLETVLTDLDAEGGRLEALVADLPEDGWRTPTPAAGWDVATQVAHLAWTDEAAHARRRCRTAGRAPRALARQPCRPRGRAASGAGR
jgi:uncharacterized protein (TIGR03083 family)